MSEYFSSFRVAAASAAESAHGALLLKYKAATVSVTAWRSVLDAIIQTYMVTVTSQVAQRPSCHGMSVSPV